MKDNYVIDFLINDIDAFKKRNESLYDMPLNEKYAKIKDKILESDTVIFYIMTGCFLENDLESPHMEVLKSNSEKYRNATIRFPVQRTAEKADPVRGTCCYILDISTSDKKKLFLDNYFFYEHDDLMFELPELDTAFKVSDNIAYAPYEFYFVSDMQVEMVVSHHTRQVVIA